MKAAIVLVIAAGCAGDLEDPARFTSCAPGDVELLLQARCGACHGAEQPDADLDLVSAGLEMRVLGASSKATCEERTLVEQGGTEHLLIEKIEAAPSCGSRMPLGQTPLTPIEIECVKRWVDALAEEAP
ncbi:MAG: hypothetical protein H0V17_22945 [Deltaproteobacteria bacterium]|nr:hypothetical protein [Deltaproteobacteria bacterium]